MHFCHYGHAVWLVVYASAEREVWGNNMRARAKPSQKKVCKETQDAKRLWPYCKSSNKEKSLFSPACKNLSSTAMQRRGKHTPNSLTILSSTWLPYAQASHRLVLACREREPNPKLSGMCSL
eukprot:719740-Pelagomonas_calceolata.AAC.2